MKAIEQLKKELNERNRNDIVNLYEKTIASNISIAIKNKAFFSLPLNNILSIVSQIAFSKQYEHISLIKSIITETITAHSDEKETVLLLHYLKTNDLDLTLDSCVDLLSLFTQCDLCVQLHKTFHEFDNTVEVDTNYLIEQKDREIDQLKHKLTKKTKPRFPPITQKPVVFIPNIFLAVKEGDLSSIQYLIEKEGVDINQISQNEDDTHFIGKGLTPLHIACLNDRSLVVQYLIEKGANIEAKDPNDCRPLHYAANFGLFHLVNSLIGKGADIEAKNSDNETPLYLACQNGFILIVTFLVEKGANIEAKCFNGSTPLHIACERGHLTVVRYLVLKGVDIEAKYEHNQTPLHIACREGHLPIVKLLIEKGANINAIDDYGETPLHFASMFGKTDVVNYLISKGANKNAKDKDGQTPFEIAWKDEIKELLK